MKLPNDMVNAFEKKGGLLKTRELVALGRSKAWIGLCVRDGLLSRIGHGVYALSGEPADDVAALLARSDKMILSHESAMYLNGLAEGAPDAICVTVPSDRRLAVRPRDLPLPLRETGTARPRSRDAPDDVRQRSPLL